MIVSRNVLQKIKEGLDLTEVSLTWQDFLEAFKKIGAKYVLY